MIGNKSIEVVKVSGTPHEMGEQRGKKFGKQLRDYVDRNLSQYERLKYPREKLDKLSMKYEAGMEKHAPRILEEMHGIADGASLNYEDILIVNLGSEIQYDEAIFKERFSAILEFAEAEEGCTSFAAYGISTADGKPLIGKNVDWKPENLKDQIFIIKKPKDGNTFITIESVGHLSGDDGMNVNGLSIFGGGGHIPKALNYEDFLSRDLKVPISLLNEVILTECDTVDEAIEYHQTKFGGIQNRQMVVGDREKLVRSEVAYGKYRIQVPEVDAEYPANYVMAATNHFSSKEMNNLGMPSKLYPSSYKRYWRAMEILTSNAGKITFDTMTDLARDHANGPGMNSICRHGPTYSIQSMICQPRDNRAWILKGNPCENKYIKCQLEK